MSSQVMSSNSLPYKIRQMLANELLSAIAIFAEHDLVEAPSTIGSFYATDPDSFLVAVVNEQKNNEPENELKEKVIACIAAPMTTHKTRHLGLYACARPYRGLDIGKHLFTYCMDEVVKDDNCGLASVPSKLKVYKHYCGFSLEEKVALVFYEGVPKNLDSLKTISQLGETFRLVRLDAGERQNGLNLSSSNSNENENNSHQPETSTEIDDQEIVEQIISYDADVHFESRQKLMMLELNQADTCTVAVLDDNKLVGFGLVRPDFLNRLNLGPLYANNSEIAQVLLGSLLQIKSDKIKSKEVCLATTSTSGLNEIAVNFLQLPKVERDEKLYRKWVPPFKYDLLYCVHTPSFAC